MTETRPLVGKLIEYRPNFSEGTGYTVRTAVVDSHHVADWLKVPFVAQWVKEPGFDKLGRQDNVLMAHFKDGRRWAVAHAEPPGLLDVLDADTKEGRHDTRTSTPGPLPGGPTPAAPPSDAG